MNLNIWWFIIAIAVLAVLLYLGRQIYLRSQRMRNRLQMERIYTDITHELLTPLTIISASVEHLRAEEPKYGYDYDMMQLNIQRMVRLLQTNTSVKQRRPSSPSCERKAYGSKSIARQRA